MCAAKFINRNDDKEFIFNDTWGKSAEKIGVRGDKFPMLAPYCYGFEKNLTEENVIETVRRNYLAGRA